MNWEGIKKLGIWLVIMGAVAVFWTGAFTVSVLVLRALGVLEVSL